MPLPGLVWGAPSPYRNALPHPSPYRNSPSPTFHPDVLTCSFGPPPCPQDRLESGQSASYWKALLLRSCINFFFVEKFSFSVSKTHIRPQLRQLVFRGRKTSHANKVEVTLHYTGDMHEFPVVHSCSLNVNVVC